MYVFFGNLERTKSLLVLHDEVCPRRVVHPGRDNPRGGDCYRTRNEHRHCSRHTNVCSKGDQSKIIKLLGEDWVRGVRVNVKLFRQPPPLLLVAQNVSGSMEGTRCYLAGLLGRGTLFRLSRSLLDPLSAEADAAEEASDSCWQPCYRIDGVHHHLPG